MILVILIAVENMQWRPLTAHMDEHQCRKRYEPPRVERRLAKKKKIKVSTVSENKK